MPGKLLAAGAPRREKAQHKVSFWGQVAVALSRPGPSAAGVSAWRKMTSGQHKYIHDHNVQLLRRSPSETSCPFLTHELAHFLGHRSRHQHAPRRRRLRPHRLEHRAHLGPEPAVQHRVRLVQHHHRHVTVVQRATLRMLRHPRRRAHHHVQRALQGVGAAGGGGAAEARRVGEPLGHPVDLLHKLSCGPQDEDARAAGLGGDPRRLLLLLQNVDCAHGKRCWFESGADTRRRRECRWGVQREGAARKALHRQRQDDEGLRGSATHPRAAGRPASCQTRCAMPA